MTLTHGTIDHLRALQTLIGKANADKGFHERGEALRGVATDYAVQYKEGHIARTESDDALRDYYTARLALITTEVAEAIEELRNGRAVDEVWYWAKGPHGTYGWVAGDQVPSDLPEGTLGKPEGVPSEIADVVIRSFDFAEEAGIDLASAIAEKLAFNASRDRLHGKKF